jgi:hypothetical protein
VLLGCELLASASLLAPALQRLFRDHSHEFLYGNVAADVIIAKNLADKENHCHNWDVGFSVLDEATNDSQRAFAWGYLCHLAADVVAHNYFVPWKLVEGFPARTTGHAYWEIRLDQKAPNDIWDLVQRLGKQPFSEQHDLLSRTIQGTIFKFETNLTIFNGMLFVQRLKRWRTLLNRVERRSKWALPQDQTEELHALAFEAILQLLQQQKQAPICQIDPTGIPHLHIAKQLRRMLRKPQHKRTLGPDDVELFIDGIRAAFKKGIHTPFSADQWPDIIESPAQVLSHIQPA